MARKSVPNYVKIHDALKDEVEKENTETICDTDCELHRVSMEEANTYMDEKKKAAPMLANATTLCILSPIPLFLIFE